MTRHAASGWTACWATECEPVFAQNFRISRTQLDIQPTQLIAWQSINAVRRPATITAADRCSKLADNHPHDCAMKLNLRVALDPCGSVRRP